MRLRVRSVFRCDAAAAWREVQKPSLLLEVIAPLASMRPRTGEQFPALWREGASHQFDLTILGGLKLAHWIRFTRVDQANRVIRTEEGDGLVQHWDHTISITPRAAGCEYVDEIEVRAGLLTPIVSAFAYLFYRHRQRRWRRVANRLSPGGLGL